MALFVHQGQAADLFGPGQHTIKTQNVPILTDLEHWDKMKDPDYFDRLLVDPRRRPPAVRLRSSPR
jgi:membrane protease subunit (stomatin/prohibitin family)